MLTLIVLHHQELNFLFKSFIKFERYSFFLCLLCLNVILFLPMLYIGGVHF
nr:MAG TPA: hypothetical protein [Caudoviricetes sp.]